MLIEQMILSTDSGYTRIAVRLSATSHPIWLDMMADHDDDDDDH